MPHNYIVEKLFILLLVFYFHDEPLAEEYVEVATEIWPPYNYLENGNLIGTSTKIVKASIERAKIPFEIAVYPWARAYALAQSRENTLIYTIMRIPEREALFQWVRPLGESDAIYLYQSSERSDIQLSSLEDAKKFMISVVRGDMNHKFLVGNGFDEKNLYLVSKQEQSLHMLLHNRVDFILFSDANVAAELKSFNVAESRIKKIMPIFESTPYMAFGKKTSLELVNKIGNAYDELIKEGKININTPETVENLQSSDNNK